MIRASGILQAATVIAKTTQTAVGSIAVGAYDYITLFFNYVNGDETGVIIKVWTEDNTDSTEYQLGEWALAGGAATFTATSYTFTANTDAYVTLDVRGLDEIIIYQGGSNNDGTPTGTLAVSYFLQGE
jgi:hypothetical protein